MFSSTQNHRGVGKLVYGRETVVKLSNGIERRGTVDRDWKRTAGWDEGSEGGIVGNE